MASQQIPKTCKYTIGEKIGTRVVVKYVATLGSTHVYKLKCLVCQVEKTMTEASIRKNDACLVCHRKRVGKQTYQEVFGND